MLLLSSLLLGCGGPAPAPMPAQAEAFQLVSSTLAAAFPGLELREPEVRWWTEPCPGTDTSAVVLGARCYSGIYYRRGGVDVAWRGSIGESAYSHELMHYFLDAAGRGSDAAHSQAGFWALVERADLQLQARGM